MTARHRLMLVEDHEPLGLQMVAALDGAGYDTHWIRRGDEALAATFDGYSLVILDLMLPGASGFDVLGHLRRQGVRTPVLIASARSDTRDKTRALDLGAIDYITKPLAAGTARPRRRASRAPARAGTRGRDRDRRAGD